MESDFWSLRREITRIRALIETATRHLDTATTCSPVVKQMFVNDAWDVMKDVYTPGAVKP